MRKYSASIFAISTSSSTTNMCIVQSPIFAEISAQSIVSSAQSIIPPAQSIIPPFPFRYFPPYLSMICRYR
ncbi:hypothetical protein COLINT_03138 [Collinsella intestinalis DSM 13280]|uniref:Uncharacterized protein n=1 Tax=Collinsella intestinalis DSM 13280 TaxID=521003 RepID=C4FAP4_9ACTN|nr:hypothetical protein COLINT_03138 [Collinsella intestinalis DSM 13280]